MKKYFLIPILGVVAICGSLVAISFSIPSYIETTKREVYREGDPIFEIGASNNGVEKHGDNIDFLLSAKPSERQLRYHE